MSTSDSGDRMPSDRPPPDVGRGPRRDLPPRARDLVDRAGATDRGARGRERVARVLAAERQLQRRHRAVRALGWAAAAVVLVAGGQVVAGPSGAAGGLALLAVLAGLRWSLARAARRRGALAWDWRARRYRLLGNPSAQVRALDRGEDDAPGPFG